VSRSPSAPRGHAPVGDVAGCLAAGFVSSLVLSDMVCLLLGVCGPAHSGLTAPTEAARPACAAVVPGQLRRGLQEERHCPCTSRRRLQGAVVRPRAGRRKGEAGQANGNSTEHSVRQSVLLFFGVRATGGQGKERRGPSGSRATGLASQRPARRDSCKPGQDGVASSSPCGLLSDGSRCPDDQRFAPGAQDS